MANAPKHYGTPLEAEDDLTLVHTTKRSSVADFGQTARRYDSKQL
jgi:hypothetical protein